jgi:hypothetical protein
MFVHYLGTVEQFKQLSNLSDYTNKIVFIKGGADGEGAAIYTHGEYYANVKDTLLALQIKLNNLKYFSKISDGSQLASVSTAEGTIVIEGEDSTVTTKIDTSGIKIGLSNEFKEQVNTILPESISAIESKLGSKDDIAASGSSTTAFSRIKNLEKIVDSLLLAISEGGIIDIQTNTKIATYNSEIIQPISDRVLANENKLSGISENANKIDISVEGDILNITIT